ncbi:hypothetical protein ACFLV7_04155 [Chloroflexota bacterium]
MSPKIFSEGIKLGYRVRVNETVSQMGSAAPAGLAILFLNYRAAYSLGEAKSG